MKAPSLLTLFLVVSSVSCASSSHRGEPGETNFVFFLVDDLGWTDIGSFGSSFYDTPNVDRLAASGQRFTNAWEKSFICRRGRCLNWLR